MPSPSGLDIANCLKYFSQVLLSKLKFNTIHTKCILNTYLAISPRCIIFKWFFFLFKIYIWYSVNMCIYEIIIEIYLIFIIVWFKVCIAYISV